MKRSFIQGAFGMVFVLAPVANWSRTPGGSSLASEPEVSSFKLADLSWFAGSWRAESGGDILEEHWMPPNGDSMIGCFRWIKAGKVWMYEMLAITSEDGKLVLRLRTCLTSDQFADNWAWHGSYIRLT